MTCCNTDLLNYCENYVKAWRVYRSEKIHSKKCYCYIGTVLQTQRKSRRPQSLCSVLYDSAKACEQLDGNMTRGSLSAVLVPLKGLLMVTVCGSDWFLCFGLCPAAGSIIHTTWVYPLTLYPPFLGFYFFNGLMFVLQALHIFWAALIIRMVIKFLPGNVCSIWFICVTVDSTKIVHCLYFRFALFVQCFIQFYTFVLLGPANHWTKFGTFRQMVVIISYLQSSLKKKKNSSCIVTQ